MVDVQLMHGMRAQHELDALKLEVEDAEACQVGSELKALRLRVVVVEVLVSEVKVLMRALRLVGIAEVE